MASKKKGGAYGGTATGMNPGCYIGDSKRMFEDCLSAVLTRVEIVREVFRIGCGKIED